MSYPFVGLILLGVGRLLAKAGRLGREGWAMPLTGGTRAGRTFIDGVTLRKPLDDVLVSEDLGRFDRFARSAMSAPDPRFVVRFHFPDSGGWFLWATYGVVSPRTGEGDESADVGSLVRPMVTFHGIRLLVEHPRSQPEEVRLESEPDDLEGLPFFPVAYKGKAKWANIRRVYEEDQPDFRAARIAREGVALASRRDNERAIERFDKALQALETAPDSIRTQRVWAHIKMNRAHAAGAMGGRLEEIRGYDAVIVRFRSSADPYLQGCVAEALFQRGVALFEIGRTHDGFASYDDLVVRFGDASDPDLLELVAFAMYNRSVNLYQLGWAEAETAFRDTADRFLAESDLRLQRVGAQARVRQAHLMGNREDFWGALHLIKDLLDQVGGTDLQEQVAGAMAEQVRALIGAGDPTRAYAVAVDVRGRFGESTNPEIREIVAWVNEMLPPPHPGLI